jgi:peptide/nickel transport system substrate-binding protein
VTDQQHPDPDAHDVSSDHRLSRRTLLRGAAGAMVAMSPLLAAACGGGGGEGGGGGTTEGGGTTSAATTSAATTSTEGQPVEGGTLRIGIVSGGTAETLNPTIGVTPIDQARAQNLYDPLVIVNPDLTTGPGLALEWNPNAEATEYEVKLRPDVTFHNGKTFTAKDVVYSINLMGKDTSFALPFVSNINLRDLKAVDDTTVKIPLKTPDADLASNFTYYNTWIVQDGETDFMNPVGTGPFKYESFTPGKESVFTKNADYWVSGKPYVDSLNIVGISDNTARLNALLAGEIDGMAFLPAAQAKAQESSGQITVLDAKSLQAFMFYMDTTQAPFTDNNVRQAMRLIADRQALIDGALGGFGTIANDIVGKGLPFYDDSLPQRDQDIEQAKSLLKQAGQENLTVQLNTSPIITGFVESATLFAQQAKAAGVTVNLKQVPADSYYNPSLLYLKMAFAQTQWPISALKFFYLQALASDAPYNETHWASESWNTTLRQAIGELDEAKAKELWNEVQKTQYEQGGYLQWTNADWVDGLSNQMKGLAPHPAGLMGNCLFLNAWLEA